jgi:hypothetical protein
LYRIAGIQCVCYALVKIQFTGEASVRMTAGVNELRLAYKKAVDDWVAAIRAEEALATTDHSMTSMEHWDAAHFTEQDAQKKATEAREAYKETLRSANYGI